MENGRLARSVGRGRPASSEFMEARTRGEPVVGSLFPVLSCGSEIRANSLGAVFMPREIITLQCGDCKERNYSTTKNRKTTTERLELKKFCRRCRKHTPHKEVK